MQRDEAQRTRPPSRRYPDRRGERGALSVGHVDGKPVVVVATGEDFYALGGSCTVGEDLGDTSTETNPSPPPVARTIDQPTPSAVDTLNRLQQMGIDLDEVGAALETQGIERFRADQQSAIDTLETKVGELIPTRSTQT